MAKEFVPSMVEKNHGMIVTIASFAAFITVPNMYGLFPYIFVISSHVSFTAWCHLGG
jgi:hypothetical protein